jgi:predicted AlkP superfamily pyrophosphatase or phosphodiesterase
MKKQFTLCVAMMVLLCTVCSLFAAGAEIPRHVILIGWDGVQRDHLRECMRRGEVPNLKTLSSEGAFVNIDVKGVTDTKAGWSQILTGCMPEVTGVYSNKKFQPIPAGLTIFERLKQHFGTERFAAVAVIAKKGNVGAEGPSMNMKTMEETKGQPYFYTKDHMDLFVNGLGDNEKVTVRAFKELAHYREKPSFFFIHYGDVDHMGHAHGENSREYNDAIISCDRELGKIVDKLKEMKEYKNTLIYVTADHGFDEGMTHHKNAPYVFLATNDRLVRSPGHREDITPTILQRFGLDLSQLKPLAAGKSLARPR